MFGTCLLFRPHLVLTNCLCITSELQTAVGYDVAIMEEAAVVFTVATFINHSLVQKSANSIGTVLPIRMYVFAVVAKINRTKSMFQILPKCLLFGTKVNKTKISIPTLLRKTAVNKIKITVHYLVQEKFGQVFMSIHRGSDSIQ